MVAEVGWLGEEQKLILAAGGGFPLNHFGELCRRPDVFHILEKTLSVSDANLKFLVLFSTRFENCVTLYFNHYNFM